MFLLLALVWTDVTASRPYGRTALNVHLEHEVRDGANQRRDPHGCRRLEASAGLGRRVAGELGRSLASSRDTARWGTRGNIRRGVLAGRSEEGVEVAEDLDWRAVGRCSRVGLHRARVGSIHGTAVDDVLGQVHVRRLGDVVDADVVAPVVSGRVLGLLVYVGPSSFEIGALHIQDEMRNETTRVKTGDHIRSRATSACGS
jgi:hypothetical protein